MKNLIVALMLIVGISGFAQEQNRKPREEKTEKLSPEQRDEMRLKKFTSDLGLNETQQKQMKLLLQEQNKTREAFRAERKDRKADGVNPTEEQRSQMKERMQKEKGDFDQKIKGILTPEQFAKMNKIRAERKDQMMEKRHQKTDSEKMEQPKEK